MLVLRLAAVDHQRQPIGCGPLHLLLEGLQLLPRKLARPIEVKPHLANGNEAIALGALSKGQGHALVEHRLHALELVGPVVIHLLGLQAHHRKCEPGILPTDAQHVAHVVGVDGGDEHLLHPRLLGPQDHLRKILAKLPTVEVGVCVDEACHQYFLFIILSA